VFSGARALALGLVDALGGPLEALAEVRERAGMRRGEPFALDLHPRASWRSLRALARGRWI
jgi:ClpP class serine protease